MEKKKRMHADEGDASNGGFTVAEGVDDRYDEDNDEDEEKLDLETVQKRNMIRQGMGKSLASSTSAKGGTDKYEVVPQEVVMMGPHASFAIALFKVN